MDLWNGFSFNIYSDKTTERCLKFDFCYLNHNLSSLSNQKTMFFFSLEQRWNLTTMGFRWQQHFIMWLLRSVQIGRYKCMMVLFNTATWNCWALCSWKPKLSKANTRSMPFMSATTKTCSVCCTEERVKSLERETTSSQCQRDIDVQDSERHFHHRTCPSQEQNITLPSISFPEIKFSARVLQLTDLF